VRLAHRERELAPHAGQLAGSRGPAARCERLQLAVLAQRPATMLPRSSTRGLHIYYRFHALHVPASGSSRREERRRRRIQKPGPSGGVPVRTASDPSDGASDQELIDRGPACER
jgi:hypothetical protein